MKKRSKRKTLRNKLDKLFSLIIRSKGRCERCGRRTTLQTAHIFSRANLAVRWDFRNAFCFCAGCHFWAHANPTEFTKFVKEKKDYKILRKKAMSIVKWTDEELKMLIEVFKALL